LNETSNKSLSLIMAASARSFKVSNNTKTYHGGCAEEFVESNCYAIDVCCSAHRERQRNSVSVGDIFYMTDTGRYWRGIVTEGFKSYPLSSGSEVPCHPDGFWATVDFKRHSHLPRNPDMVAEEWVCQVNWGPPQTLDPLTKAWLNAGWNAITIKPLPHSGENYEARMGVVLSQWLKEEEEELTEAEDISDDDTWSQEEEEKLSDDDTWTQEEEEELSEVEELSDELTEVEVLARLSAACEDLCCSDDEIADFTCNARLCNGTRCKTEQADCAHFCLRCLKKLTSAAGNPDAYYPEFNGTKGLTPMHTKHGKATPWYGAWRREMTTKWDTVSPATIAEVKTLYDRTREADVVFAVDCPDQDFILRMRQFAPVLVDIGPGPDGKPAPIVISKDITTREEFYAVRGKKGSKITPVPAPSPAPASTDQTVAELIALRDIAAAKTADLDAQITVKQEEDAAARALVELPDFLESKRGTMTQERATILGEEFDLRAEQMEVLCPTASSAGEWDVVVYCDEF
jgi:hypothetical protein